MQYCSVPNVWQSNPNNKLQTSYDEMLLQSLFMWYLLDQNEKLLPTQVDHFLSKDKNDSA